MEAEQHHNPFEVLELPATASARDVARQKDKLLGMLELGLERAKTYASSIGDQERTADLVRSAAQELERPRSRLSWELWLKPSDDQVAGDPDAAAIRRALVLHHVLLREASNGTPFGVEELDELGTAWDEVFSSYALNDRVAARAEALELELDHEEVIDELREEVRKQMFTMLERGPRIDLDALTSELASELGHQFADRKVEVLELACGRISKTNLQQRRQQWHGLVAEYADVVAGRGDYLRRAAFQAINPGLTDLAVELFNNDIDHSTALSMFEWLREEAHNLEYEDLHAQSAKNASIVRERIQRDNQATYAAEYHDTSVRTESEWGAGRIVFIVVAIVVALLRAGNGCKDTSYSPSSFTPSRFELDRDRYRDLYRNRSQDLPSLEELQRLENEVRLVPQPNLNNELEHEPVSGP